MRDPERGGNKKKKKKEKNHRVHLRLRAYNIVSKYRVHPPTQSTLILLSISFRELYIPSNEQITYSHEEASSFFFVASGRHRGYLLRKRGGNEGTKEERKVARFI